MSDESDHLCNAWCVPPRHAHLVLISPECTTEKDVFEHVAEPYLTHTGWRILSAKLAHEADREKLIAAKTGKLGMSTRGRTEHMPRNRLLTMNAWLIHCIKEPF